MLNAKIADHHLARQACIYIRQSTMAQVRLNQESTERQYNPKRFPPDLNRRDSQRVKDERIFVH